MKKLFFTFVIALMVLVIIVGGCANQTPGNESQMQFNTLSEVKCDGKEYNLAVKPENAVVLLTFSAPFAEPEQCIAGLKASGLANEIYEIGRSPNESDAEFNLHITEYYENTQRTDVNNPISCNVMYIVGLPSENCNALADWKQENCVSCTYSLLSMYAVLSNNTREKDVRLFFTGKLAE